MKNTKTLNRIITAVLLICVMLSGVGVTAYATSDTDVVVVEDGDVGAAPAKVPYVVSHEYYCVDYVLAEVRVYLCGAEGQGRMGICCKPCIDCEGHTRQKSHLSDVAEGFVHYRTCNGFPR